MQLSSSKSIVNWLLWALIAAGLALRLYRITANEFLFYDEGMYLGYNRTFLNLVAANPPGNISDFIAILGLMAKAALSTAKALWFFILNLRVFVFGAEGWAFARLISAAAGIGTIYLTYIWARRYFSSKPTAIISAAVLAILPSHVFYSRLGMQESLSTFLFLMALYFYTFSKRSVSVQSILAAVLLAAVYFTNYRMIIGPVFIVLIQCWSDRASGQSFDLRKCIWFCLAFGALVFGIGALYGGINTYVTFGWMFHQADESHAHRHIINFLSFPYYIFALDNIIFGLLFFANIVLAVRRQWSVLLPFAIACAQMFIFSFAAEKGARYLCVVLPFIAMASAYMLVWLWNTYQKYQRLIAAAALIMAVGLLWQSTRLARAETGYGKAIAMVLAHDPQAKMISTQPLVESLYVQDERRVSDCPKDGQGFAYLFSQGYRYLLIDPQAYISWTADDQRFTPELIDVLTMIQKRFPPVAVVPHLDEAMLTRFVLDHNQDLYHSIQFLKNARDKGDIYIYDLFLSAK